MALTLLSISILSVHRVSSADFRFPFNFGVFGMRNIGDCFANLGWKFTYVPISLSFISAEEPIAFSAGTEAVPNLLFIHFGDLVFIGDFGAVKAAITFGNEKV